MTAERAVEILEGKKKPGDIPVARQETSRIVMNRTALAALGTEAPSGLTIGVPSGRGRAWFVRRIDAESAGRHLVLHRAPGERENKKQRHAEGEFAALRHRHELVGRNQVPAARVVVHVDDRFLER